MARVALCFQPAMSSSSPARILFLLVLCSTSIIWAISRYSQGDSSIELLSDAEVNLIYFIYHAR
jgi:hypothetical protein